MTSFPFDVISDLLAGASELDPVAGLDGELLHCLHVSGTPVWHAQTFAGGRLIGWTECSGPPREGLVLVQSGGWDRYVPRAHDPTTAWVDVWDNGSSIRKEIPPLDDGTPIPGARRVAGADVTIRSRYVGGPTGTMATRWVFRDGLPVVLEPIEPDIVLGDDIPDQHLDISLPWSVFGQLRTGELELLEALVHADGLNWAGRWSTPLLVRGLLDAPSSRDHDRTLGFVPPLLVSYAELVNAAGWRRLAAPLLAASDDPAARDAGGSPTFGYAVVSREVADEGTFAVEISVADRTSVKARRDVDLFGADEIVDQLVADCEEASSHSGGRIVGVANGELVLDVSAGQAINGRQFDSLTISSVYCAAKPAIAAAVGRLIFDSVLSADDRVGSLVTAVPAWLADVEIQHLLTHSSGLHVLDRMFYQSLPLSLRRSLLTGAARAEGFRPGLDAAYCEVGSWHLVAEIIEVATGLEFDVAIRDLVLDPWSIAVDDLTMRLRPDQFERVADRLSVNVDAVALPPVPILSEGIASASGEPDPVFGPYGSPLGIAQLWAGILNDFEGAGLVLPPDLAARILEPTHPDHFDSVLQRDVAFGWASLCPPAPGLAGWVGHGAEGGLAFGAAKPAGGLVVGAVFNGCLDRDTGLLLRAGALVRSLERLTSDRVPRTSV